MNPIPYDLNLPCLYAVRCTDGLVALPHAITDNGGAHVGEHVVAAEGSLSEHVSNITSLSQLLHEDDTLPPTFEHMFLSQNHNPTGKGKSVTALNYSLVGS